MPATALEQLQLELINEARLNPLASAARYITSYSPLTSNQPNIQQNFNSWGVNGTALQNAFNALQPVQPLAWNESLGNAARTHSVNMGSANQQTHTSLQGEAIGDPNTPNDDPGARMQANGYGSFTAWGENIAAQGQDSLHILASLMVDWGNGPNGMQSPPGHRNNIMGINTNPQQPIQSTFREIGIGIATVTPQSNVGPLAVTEDFATHGTAGAFVLGVAYNDTDNDKFYSINEGLGGLVVSAVGGASTASASTGGYSLFTTQVGAQHITFTGGGLSGSVDFATSLSNGQNLKIDIVNGTTLRTSVSGTITGPVTRIEGLGIIGLTLTADGGAQTIVGTKGNDTLNGGGGTDTAFYAGNRADYTITNNADGSMTVTGAQGTDTLNSIERIQFADDDVRIPTVTGVNTPSASGWQVVATGDFNHDLTTDLMWRNTSTGQTAGWLMANGAPVSTPFYFSSAGWNVLTTGDFNADGNTDILWGNGSQAAVWLMANGAVASHPVLPYGTTGWSVIASGDFNKDGTTDILLKNDANGSTAAWFMANGQVSSHPFLLSASGWNVVATGDFNKDGTTDIMWKNAANGTVAEWLMGNGGILSNSILPYSAQGWNVAATGDFNGDGSADVLWKNAANGNTAAWLMQNGQVAEHPVLLSASGWNVAAVGDLNSDGTTDVLWRNPSNGTTAAWLMAEGIVAETPFFPSTSGYNAIASGRFNADNTTDVIWEHTVNHSTVDWLFI